MMILYLICFVNVFGTNLRKGSGALMPEDPPLALLQVMSQVHLMQDVAVGDNKSVTVAEVTEGVAPTATITGGNQPITDTVEAKEQSIPATGTDAPTSTKTGTDAPTTTTTGTDAPTKTEADAPITTTTDKGAVHTTTDADGLITVKVDGNAPAITTTVTDAPTTSTEATDAPATTAEVIDAPATTTPETDGSIGVGTSLHTSF